MTIWPRPGQMIQGRRPQLLSRTMDGQRVYADTMALTPTTTREPAAVSIEVPDRVAANNALRA